MISPVDPHDEPMGKTIEPEVILTLIHGTFTQEAEWTRAGSAFCARLETAFGKRIAVEKFQWSGDNSIFARLEAGRELAERIKANSTQHSGARQILIAHSHAGNVALYALRDARANAQVAGLACIATPFLHAHLRDSRLFDGNILQDAIFGLWGLGLILVSSFSGFSFGMTACFIIFFVGIIIGLLISGVLGGYLARAVKTVEPFASTLAVLFGSFPPSALNLLILRKVGDEASLALGVSQLLSWAASRAFALSARDQFPEGPYLFKPFIRGPIPKAVWMLWRIFFAVFVVTIVWNGILEEGPGDLLRWFLLLSGVLAVIGTATAKLRGCKSWLFGVTFLGLAIATSFGTFVFGTAPARRMLDMGGVLSHFFLGVVLYLLIEVNTEATPAGGWVIQQFEPRDNDRSADRGLAHSAYTDPRVIDKLVLWVAASTGSAIVNHS